MDILNAIYSRHSVRNYIDRQLDIETINKLNEFIYKCNIESGLNIQLITDEPKAFDCFLAHYGKFSGVKNYFAIVGNKNKSIYENIGYYGEKIVLYAQTLGLNTCWVALTYKKITEKIKINKGQKLHVIISVGYGQTQGNGRKSKNCYDVCKKSDYPEWFKKGINCALLAPTAMNQQKFYFSLTEPNQVNIKSRAGFYSKMDLGIVKYHFEIGAGKENFIWKK